jgi:cytochrome bd-type quinol oxidase subunit 2
MVEMVKKKGIKELWDDIELPVIVLVVWGIIAVFFRIDQYFPNKILYSSLSLVISLVVFGYIGYSLAKDKKEKDATRAGAYAGVIVGLISAVITIISFYVMPELFSEQITTATKAGADPNTIKLFVQIGLYFGLIISPIISGAIGAFSSWVGSKIFKKVK